MARRQPQSQPTWTDVKAKLAGFDRLGLLGLIQDLYAANKDNRTFLHARFGLGQNVLAPYKEALDRWLWPDVLRNQDTSVVKAKHAISSYRKAVGEPAGLAELMVFYCERAAGFCNDIGYQDDGYFDAMVSMFEQALKAIAQLPTSDRNTLTARLGRVRVIRAGALPRRAGAKAGRAGRIQTVGRMAAKGAVAAKLRSALGRADPPAWKTERYPPDDPNCRSD